MQTASAPDSTTSPPPKIASKTVSPNDYKSKPFEKSEYTVSSLRALTVNGRQSRTEIGLRELAQSFRISHINKLSKEELISAILKAQSVRARV